MKKERTKCCLCINLRTGVQILAVTYVICEIGVVIGSFFDPGIVTFQIDKKYDQVLWWIFVPFSAVLAVASALMLFGACVKNRCFLIPWLILAMLDIIIGIINMIHFFIVALPYKKTEEIDITEICGKIIIKIAIYYWFVVRDFYIALGLSRDEREVSFTALKQNDCEV